MRRGSVSVQSDVVAINNHFIYQLSLTELSYSQKLIVEHTRYQDLQQKHQRMQEGYETQLKAAEAARIQALEELMQHYEARLQERSQLLAEVRQ